MPSMQLDLGKREPVTEEEKLFVAVCRGEREPVTEAERVWIQYMTRIKRPKRFHTLSGGKTAGWKVLKTTPILMINKKGRNALFFMSVVFADG